MLSRLSVEIRLQCEGAFGDGTLTSRAGDESLQFHSPSTTKGQRLLHKDQFNVI